GRHKFSRSPQWGMSLGYNCASRSRQSSTGPPRYKKVVVALKPWPGTIKKRKAEYETNFDLPSFQQERLRFIRVGVLRRRRFLENFDSCCPITSFFLAICHPQRSSGTSSKSLDVLGWANHLSLLVVIEQHFGSRASLDGDSFGGGVDSRELSFKNFRFGPL